MGRAMFLPCREGVTVTSSKRTYVSMMGLPGLWLSLSLTLQQATFDLHFCQRFSLTGKSGSVSCGVNAPFSWVLVYTRFCLCSPRVSVFPVLWKFCNQILMTFQVTFPGDSHPFVRYPGWEVCCGAWTFTTMKEVFGIIVFQFVYYPSSGSIVGIMATSSKRTYATCCTSQDFCCQSACSRSRLLLAHASIGNPQIVTGRSDWVSCGDHCSFPWVPVCTKFCSYPPSVSGRHEVWF